MAVTALQRRIARKEARKRVPEQTRLDRLAALQETDDDILNAEFAEFCRRIDAIPRVRLKQSVDA